MSRTRSTPSVGRIGMSGIALVLSLAGCSQNPGTDARPPDVVLPTARVASAAMHSWDTRGGQAVINTLIMDTTSIAADGGSKRLQTDCLGLGDDASKARAADPIPDARTEASWESVLRAVQDGYSDCIGGYSANNPSQVAKGRAEIGSAAPGLKALADLLGGGAP